MGERIDGLAKLRRLHAGNASEFQKQGGCHHVCAEAGLRVLCARAKYAQVHSESVCDAIRSQSGEIEECEDEVGSDSAMLQGQEVGACIFELACILAEMLINVPNSRTGKISCLSLT